MENNELKAKIQNEALQVWEAAGKKGTCEIITGLGKTFLALHALYTMPKNDILHVFLAEQVDREKDLIKDIIKYNTIFHRNVLKDYNLQFQCYQTVRNWKGKKLGLVIADEIHDSLTEKNCEFYFNNEFNAILGLSAFIKTDLYYCITRKNGEKELLSKGDLLREIAPLCFKYTINQGQKEGTSRKLNIYVINHKLNDKDKNVPAGTLSKKFFQTEKRFYEYYHKQLVNTINSYPKDGDDLYKFEETKNIKIVNLLNKRNTLLYELPSKITSIKFLLKAIKGKTIIFGNSIDSLLKITPNVVSSRNKQEENDKLRDYFDNDVISILASFKKLQQGANLDKVDNCILHSYYSSEGINIQRLGRLRINEDKIGNVFIFRTVDTQEEVWYSKMMENATEYNIIECENIHDCLEKYKKENGGK